MDRARYKTAGYKMNRSKRNSSIDTSIGISIRQNNISLGNSVYRFTPPKNRMSILKSSAFSSNEREFSLENYPYNISKNSSRAINVKKMVSENSSRSNHKILSQNDFIDINYETKRMDSPTSKLSDGSGKNYDLANIKNSQMANSLVVNSNSKRCLEKSFRLNTLEVKNEITSESRKNMIGIDLAGTPLLTNSLRYNAKLNILNISMDFDNRPISKEQEEKNKKLSMISRIKEKNKQLVDKKLAKIKMLGRYKKGSIRNIPKKDLCVHDKNNTVSPDFKEKKEKNNFSASVTNFLAG